MKKLKYVLTALVLSGAVSWVVAEDMKSGANQPAGGQSSQSASPAKKKPMKKAKMKKAEAPNPSQKTALYKCEHCNVTSDKPGKCPMCGMEMKKI